MMINIIKVSTNHYSTYKLHSFPMALILTVDLFDAIDYDFNLI